MPCPLVIPVTWEKSGELGSEFILGYTLNPRAVWVTEDPSLEKWILYIQ